MDCQLLKNKGISKLQEECKTIAVVFRGRKLVRFPASYWRTTGSGGGFCVAMLVGKFPGYERGIFAWWDISRIFVGWGVFSIHDIDQDFVRSNLLGVGGGG
jgi:hypothetical protein